MMSMDHSVKVAVRIRPLSDTELANDNIHCINAITESNQIVAGADQAFSFDHVFGEETMQEQIYDQCVVDLINAAFEGFNATILAYGQTGSGKTWTMGSSADMRLTAETMGIIPRVIHSLFDAVQQKEQEDSRSTFKVSVQFLEIYGEDIKDLLDGTKTSKVTIRESVGGDVYISGAREELVSSSAQMMKALEEGTKHRVTASTRMNQSSSRSHAIFTVILEHTIHQVALIDSNTQDGDSPRSPKTDSMASPTPPTLTSTSASTTAPQHAAVRQGKENEVRKSKFHFVDLAGSERAKRTGAQGQQLKEGIDINKGLLALGNVISALGDEAKRGKVHVPYRDSRLTRILQDSLGGNSKTLFICCVSPAGVNFYESLNALRYANRARNIKNKPIVNRDPTLVYIDELKALVQGLAVELKCVRKKGLRLPAATSDSSANEPTEAFTDEQLESLSTITSAQNLSSIAGLQSKIQASIATTSSTGTSMALPAPPSAFASNLGGMFPIAPPTSAGSAGSGRTGTSSESDYDRKAAMMAKYSSNGSAAKAGLEASSSSALSAMMKEAATMKSRLLEAEVEIRSLTDKLKIARSQASDFSERVVLKESECEFYKMKWSETNPTESQKLHPPVVEGDENVDPQSVPPANADAVAEKDSIVSNIGKYIREIERLKTECAELRSTRVVSNGLDMFSSGDINTDGELSASVAKVIAQTQQQLVLEAKKMRVATGQGDEKGASEGLFDEDLSEGDAGLKADEEERQFQHRQRMMQQEMQELGESIQLKEQLVSQLQRSQHQYVVMRAFYEEKLTLLVQEMEEKQAEREKLVAELQSVQENSANDAAYAATKSAREEKLRAELRKKDSELSTMKRRQAELNDLSQVQNRYLKQVNKLESDIESMKRQRVNLTKTLNSEKKSHATMLQNKTKEIEKLKRELVKYAGEVKKLGVAKDRAEDKAREAIREGNMLRKRANDSTSVARTARKAMSGAGSRGAYGTGRFITEDQVKVKKYVEKCMVEISNREKTAEELRRQCELQLALISEKEELDARRLEQEERLKHSHDDSDDDSHDDDLVELENKLESISVQLKMRNDKILDMQQTLAVIDQKTSDEKMLEVLKRGSASSLPQAQDLIKLLFGMLAQSRRVVNMRQEALNLVSEKEQKLKAELDVTHARMAAAEREHDRELTKAMNDYEEKLQGLFNHSSVGQVVLAESGLTSEKIAAEVGEPENDTWQVRDPGGARLSFGLSRPRSFLKNDDTEEGKASKTLESYKMLVTVTTEQCNNLKSNLMKKTQLNNDLQHKVMELEEARLQLQRELDERLNFIAFLEDERQLFREMADDLRAGMQSMGGSLGQSIIQQVRQKAVEKGNAITVHGQGMVSQSLLLQSAEIEAEDDEDDTMSVMNEFENIADEINRTGAISADKPTTNKHVYDRLTNPTNYTGHMKKVFEKDLEKKRRKVQLIKRQERVPKKDAPGVAGSGRERTRSGDDRKYANFMADYLEDDDGASATSFDSTLVSSLSHDRNERDWAEAHAAAGVLLGSVDDSSMNGTGMLRSPATRSDTSRGSSRSGTTTSQPAGVNGQHARQRRDSTSTRGRAVINVNTAEFDYSDDNSPLISPKNASRRSSQKGAKSTNEPRDFVF